MGKGAETREAILHRAVQLASEVGLEGVTIGRLAEAMDLSKSGLFAHFQSKEALQVATLEHAGALFVEAVVRPAMAEPRGAPRIRALVERWLRWPELVPQPGGCVFVQAAVELDDRPGPARELLVSMERAWLGTLARVARDARDGGQFRADVDPDQVAFELHGIMLTTHHAWRLLGDRHARRRARAAVERLLADCRLPA
ncbi:transcriptional regulator, TetR family [Anaeromyxobacter dehalogenans 2CP-1]|uniref:Transcriptional regulator, TetR family n=1 Tax=Anaeromyxobacter dehalogenans (strain ATCC BAA-258 / DSM 21875 / 2CP-1) TaxID=455488 RepID=B8JGZ1_ANAD2|nr:TetR/AcrR family transcriptional regulator [Anaeromyxobacter dehalogenans]ACL66628.1 transcriptional regulator, TetR family [Anaeromyxobacter dehalogenans 2CP-1]